MTAITAGTLSDLLAKRGRLPVTDAAKFAMQILEELARLHAFGKVNGTIEPAMIRIDGMRASLGPAAGAPYLSPEQELGKTATPASDVYAVGLVLFEMLTGSAARLRIPVDGSPKWLSDVVDRATRQNAAERFSNAQEMRDQIDMGLSGLLSSEVGAHEADVSTSGGSDETVVGMAPVEETLAVPGAGCPKCGFAAPAGRSNCPNCGSSLSGDDTRESPRQAPIPIAGAPKFVQAPLPASPGAPPIVARRERPPLGPDNSSRNMMIALTLIGVVFIIFVFSMMGRHSGAVEAGRNPKGYNTKTPDGPGSQGGRMNISCPYCNNDGRIDPEDQAREVPRTNAPLGKCPYCTK
jgi:hypothetical protein